MSGLGAGGGTALYGVVGHPLAQTLSPPMHNAAFRALGLEATYLPLPIQPARLTPELHALAGAGARGLNVTSPFKAAVLDWADEVEPIARRARSANTLTLRAGRAVASSTDGAGFLQDLEAWGLSPRGLRSALIGAGGAARALAVALAGAGARVTCFARHPARASTEVPWDVVPLDRLVRGEATELDLLVNATPPGALGEGRPAVAWEALAPAARVYDLVYVPAETPFLSAAAAAGHPVRSGIGMLLHQGAHAFEAWTGLGAPLDVMAEAIGAPDLVA